MKEITSVPLNFVVNTVHSNKQMFEHESNTTILPQGLLSSRPLNRNWFPIVSTRYHLGLEMEFTLGKWVLDTD